MDFADWFAEMCNKHKITPTLVAEKIGVSAAAASYWINGRNTPKETTRKKIEQFFGEKYEKEKSAAPAGATLQDTDYSKLSDANRAIIDDLIAKLLKSQSDD